MKATCLSLVGAGLFCLSGGITHGDINIVIGHNDNEHASAAFKFNNLPSPARNDAAAQAQFTLVYGQPDGNGGDLNALHDGKVPTEEDQPGANFFFNAGTAGGRLLVDLGKIIELKQINTYSWHPNTRGPQVYQLYGSDGKTNEFNARPTQGTEPANCGWKAIARVDTRPKEGEGGGQYGVSISDSEGALGSYRYLLFDIARTEDEDSFGNTFYSEIDVIDLNAPAVVESTAAQPAREIIETADGKYQLTIDTTETPDLTEWARQQLAPVVREWYPKIVQMLPSEGYEAPTSVSIIFSKDMRGVAATGGTRVRCAGGWFQQNLKGEAVGAVVHELVHVVQQYGRARRTNPNATRSPGWLVEGLADYIRWFLYEPQSHGAEITQRNLARARYDANYRISANFLNWVIGKYDPQLVMQMNTAMREGKYEEALWKQYAGKTVQELGDEWKDAQAKKLAAAPAATAEAKPNTLTETEKAAGWKLLFNGRDFEGWHNFKRDGVRSGWQIKDGALMCADPHNAGDIVTAEQYDWFELQLDYNITAAGNSGIMYHVTDAGNAAWATGPEFQLEDNQEAADKIRCGWLYGLYQPPLDPKTGKPLDATKPVGEWNHVRLLIAPEKCEHEINGMKYFEYVLHSDEFNERVAQSKFRSMPNFAKFDRGYIALQGDHGQISFRNIKIRSIAPK